MVRVKHFSQGAFFLEIKIFFQKKALCLRRFYLVLAERKHSGMILLKGIGYYMVARVGLAKDHLLAAAAGARASEVGRTIECFVVLPIVLAQDGIVLAKEKLEGLVPPNPFDLPPGEYEYWGSNNPPAESPDHPIPGEAETARICGQVL